jgi:hypothetical protein
MKTRTMKRMAASFAPRTGSLFLIERRFHLRMLVDSASIAITSVTNERLRTLRTHTHMQCSAINVLHRATIAQCKEI